MALRGSLFSLLAIAALAAMPRLLRPAAAGALYLLEQPGARAMATGNASSASSQGVEGLRSNPAGLRGAEKLEAGLAHHEDGGGWSHEWIGLVAPLGQWRLGFEWMLSSLDPIPDYDAFGNQVGSIEIGSQVYGLAAAWATESGNYVAGLAGRGFTSKVGPYSNSGYAADLGLQAKLFGSLRLGLAAVNLGSQSAYISKAAPLPTGLRTGWEWLAWEGKIMSVEARGGYDYFPDVAAMTPYKFGMELGFGRAFFLSSGIQVGKFNNQASFGAAYEGSWLGISYAYLPGDLVGASHLFTLKSKGLPFSRSQALKALEEGLLTVKVAGEEALPPLESWTLEFLDAAGTVLKTRKGKDALPAQLAWDGVSDAGEKVATARAARLRIVVTDRFGVVTSSERRLGVEVRPRELQRSAPLFAEADNGKGGLLLRTQLERQLPGVKSWKLNVSDASGKILKTMEGQGALPRSLDLGAAFTKGGAKLSYDLTAQTEDGRISSLGSLARSVRPKELMVERPSFNPEEKALRLDIRPQLAAEIKNWTLTIKAADGLVLKTLSGVGPVPKDLRFDPDSIKLPGLDLGARKSGSAFVQVALAYSGADGQSSVVSDAMALPVKSAAMAPSADRLSEDEFRPLAGREFVAIALPALRSTEPGRAARGSQLFRLPEGVEAKAWSVEFLSGSKILGRVHGNGAPPAYVAWAGPEKDQPALDESLLDSLRLRVLIQEKGGVETALAEGEAMRRSFSASPEGRLTRRIHAAWFSKGESDLQPEMVERLDLVAELLKAQPGASAVIQGHCSKEGDDTINARLAKERAESVLRYLTQDKGIAPGRLTANGFSNQLLLDERADDDAVRRNRRVDVVLLP